MLLLLTIKMESSANIFLESVRKSVSKTGWNLWIDCVVWAVTHSRLVSLWLMMITTVQLYCCLFRCFYGPLC